MKVLTFALGAMRTNTYFVFDSDGSCAVIDPGMDAQGIYEKLQQKGLSPSHILLTHGHFDHSEAVKELAEKTGAIVCIHKEDGKMLEDPRINSANFYYRGNFDSYPRAHADLLLNDKEKLQVGSLTFMLLHTPGHTPGSCCYAIEDHLFCGDTVFAYGFGRYDLWGGDKLALADSLEKIASLSQPFKLLPGHGNTASLIRIRDQILQDASALKN